MSKASRFVPMFLYLQQSHRRPLYVHFYNCTPDNNAIGNWNLLCIVVLQPVGSTLTNFHYAWSRSLGMAETRTWGITRTWWVLRQPDKILVKDVGQIPTEMWLLYDIKTRKQVLTSDDWSTWELEMSCSLSSPLICTTHRLFQSRLRKRTVSESLNSLANNGPWLELANDDAFYLIGFRDNYQRGYLGLCLHLR